MPRQGQIIPKWLHPHEETFINDNTEYKDYTSGNTGPTFLNIFRSKKGRDNVLRYYDSISKWIEDYGLPEFRKYGQPGYNAFVSLSTGLATSQSMRVMPLDAGYSHCIVLAKYQNTGKALKLKFETVQIQDGITDLDLLDDWVQTLRNDTPDESSYKTLPLFSVWSRGRGEYGNDYRIRITHNPSADKDNQYVNYVFEVMSMETGSLKVLETYNISFYVDARDPNGGNTLFMNDIIDDEHGVGSDRINSRVYYENLEILFNEYKKAFDKAVNSTPTDHSVVSLPNLKLLDPTTLFILKDNSDQAVKVYDTATSQLVVSTEYTTIKNIDSESDRPPLLPKGLDETEDGIIISKTERNKVYKFVTATKLIAEDTGATFVMKTGNLMDGDLTVNNIYKVSRSTNMKYPDGYYLATDTSVATPLTNVYEGKYVHNSNAYADSKTIYNIKGETYVVSKSDTGVYSYVVIPYTRFKELVAWTDYPNLAIKGDTYTLSVADGDKLAGTKWIVHYGDDEWSPYEDSKGVHQDCPYNIGNWDVFGYNRFTLEDDPYFEFDGGKEHVDILSIEGIALNGGNEGSFDVEKNGTDLVESAVNRAYMDAIQAASGYDKTIASKRRAPIDIILDAAFDNQIKRALVALAVKRGDCVVHLDAKLIPSAKYFDDFYNQFSDLQQYIVSVDPQWFKTSDPNTGRIIPVTMTLWLAMKYPIHFNIYGNNTPLAGERYAKLSGYEKNSIMPIIDGDDVELKEKLYVDYKFNYVECLAENTFARGTQLTFQNKWSDLSEENNVLVLLEIKRKIERLTAANRYEWADPDHIRLFEKDCDEVFSSYRGTKCKSLTIQVKMNKWEETRYIIHVYLAVVFKTFQKRAIIEIDVNPRA